MRKSTNIPSERTDRDEDEVHTQHKRQTAEKGKRPPSPYEIKTVKDKEIYKSPRALKHGLDMRSVTKKILEQQKNDKKDNSTEGNHTIFPYLY